MPRSQSDALAQVRDALERYRVTGADGFDLSQHATDDLPAGLDKKLGRSLLAYGIERLSTMQERLYADGRWSLLVVFQAMDAGGKDSTIKHVMSGVNPQGVAVTSFKEPGPTERAHDFLWRIGPALPARGQIGIFNRSHYEDVLVTRVHPDLVEASGLPAELRAAPHFWADRIADIACFEGYLGRQGTRLIKFFLHVGKDKQRKRFLKRLAEPEKQWKFAASDIRERRHWDAYQSAYQDAIAGTATPQAPWFVIPADRKWFMQLAVAEAIVGALDALPLHVPVPSAKAREEMAVAAEALREEAARD